MASLPLAKFFPGLIALGISAICIFANDAYAAAICRYHRYKGKKKLRMVKKTLYAIGALGSCLGLFMLMRAR
jgi:hypothetical protein